MRYTVNDSFFSNIDCSNQAYILGFILGDGNLIMRSSWTLQITLHQQDTQILEEIKNQIESNKPLYYWNMTQESGKITPCVGLRITSNQIGKDLISYGITPKKTGKEIWPNIPQSFYPDLIRGIFDADGCLSIINKGGYNAYKASIRCKNKNILQHIQNLTSCGNIYNHDGCPTLEISNRYDICKFGKYIYYNSDILHLSRKKNRFDDMPKPYLFEAFGELKTYRDWLKDNRMLTKTSEFYRRLNNTKMTLEECMTMPVGMFPRGKNYRKIVKMGSYPIEEFPKIGFFS